MCAMNVSVSDRKRADNETIRIQTSEELAVKADIQNAFALADDGVLVYTAILDVSQQNIAIIGAYGSGKTNLLLHCARWLYDTGCANIRFTRKTEHGMVTDDGKPLPSHKRTIWIVDDADEALNPFSSAPEANELREALVNPNITVIAAVEKPISALLDRCPTRVAFPCGERSNDLMLGIPGAILDPYSMWH